MSVTIQDMQTVASELGPPSNISSDIGNVIEVSNLEDDLGLNLLANQNKIKIDGSTTQSKSFGSAPIRLSVPENEYKQVSFGGGLEPIDLNLPSNNLSTEIPGNAPLAEISIQKEYSPYNNYQTSTAPSISLTPAPPRDLERENLEKIEDQGVQI